MADIFAAVDLSTVATFAAATGVLIIGIAMTFKGIDLAKRADSSADLGSSSKYSNENFED